MDAYKVLPALDDVEKGLPGQRDVGLEYSRSLTTVPMRWRHCWRATEAATEETQGGGPNGL